MYNRWQMKLKDKETQKTYNVSYHGLASQPKEKMRGCILEGGHSFRTSSYNYDSKGQPYDKSIVCSLCDYNAFAKLDKAEHKLLIYLRKLAQVEPHEKFRLTQMDKAGTFM